MTLYLIRGIPGAGKSTLAKTLLRSEVVDAVHEADDYFIKDNGCYDFNLAGLPAAHAQCLQRVEADLKAGKNVAVSNTCTTAKEVRFYEQLAVKCGVQLTSLVVETRHNNSNVHFVPDDKLDKMRQRFNLEL